MRSAVEWRDPGDIELKSTPQQSRSRDTLDRLVAAADAEFAANGLAGATTTSIADRAGVSVGALYRFFDDKRAIADALAQRYLADAYASFGELLAGVAAPADVAPAVRGLVRRAADLQHDHTGYYRLAQDLRPDGDDSPGHVVRTTLVDSFADCLTSIGLGDADDHRPVIELIVETVRHVLVVHPPGSPGRDDAVTELETMVAAYVSARLDLE